MKCHLRFLEGHTTIGSEWSEAAPAGCWPSSGHFGISPHDVDFRGGVHWAQHRVQALQDGHLGRVDGGGHRHSLRGAGDIRSRKYSKNVPFTILQGFLFLIN